MKETSFSRVDLGSQKGSATYSFLGYAIVAVVVIITIFAFPWDSLKTTQDADLIAGNDALAKKQWEQAKNAFDKSLKANPGNSAAYVGRSKALLYMGQWDKALQDAKAATEKNPSSAVAFGQKAIVEKLLQKPEDALKDFSTAVKLDPNYAWALAQRADILSRNNDHAQALEDLKKALIAKPNFVDAYRLRAWVLTRLGKCREASESFKKVAELSPNDASSIQDRAWFLLTCPDEKLQNPAEAMQLAVKAVQLTDERDGVALETLAEACFRANDFARAADLQRRAIELGSLKCPDNSCVKEMQERLQKYEMASRPESRINYEVLSVESGN